jgi:hypothetical protein
VDYDVWGEEDEKTINFPFFSKSFAAQNERSAGQNEELMKKREKNDVWPRASFFCKREERGESSRRQKNRFFYRFLLVLLYIYYC